MVEERAPGNVGARLRESRERRGLTLPEIAASTKLPLRTLESIERNDVAQLPGGIFRRSFIRSFAVEVGLDPDETVREFASQFPDRSLSSAYPTTAPSGQRIDTSERRRAWALRLLLIVGTPLAAALLYVAGSGRQLPPPEEVVAAASADGIPVSVTGTGSPSSTAPLQTSPATVAAEGLARLPQAVDPAAADSLVVELTATERCWVSASADGVQVVRKEFEPDERLRVNVRTEFELTAGNAGGLAMTLNGMEARSLGRRGKVVTVRIDRRNFQRFLAEQ